MSLDNYAFRTAAKYRQINPRGPNQLLYAGRALDFTLATDQALSRLVDFTNCMITHGVAVLRSGAFNTACAGGIYTATAKGGNAIVAAAQSYANLTAYGKIVNLTLAAVASTDMVAVAPLYFSLTTGNGAALTGDVLLWGIVID